MISDWRRECGNAACSYHSTSRHDVERIHAPCMPGEQVAMARAHNPELRILEADTAPRTRLILKLLVTSGPASARRPR